MRIPTIIYGDLEYLIKRIDECKNKFEKSYKREVCEPIPSGYSMFAIWSFDGIENKHDVYRGENFMKTFLWR